MRRRASIRTRLTVAVGVVSACFLALSAYLLSTRASSQVLAGVRADQLIYTATFPSDLPAAVAVDTFRQLQAAGLVDTFYDAVGQGRPGPADTVTINDGTTSIAVAGPGGTSGPRLPASLVVQLGEPLLHGVPVNDLIVVGVAPPGNVNDTIQVAVDNAGPSPVDSGGSGGAASGGGGASGVNGATGRTGVAVADGGPLLNAVAAVPVANVRSSVNDIGRTLWLAAALLTVVAMIATWLLTGRALRPVEAITGQVEAISAAGSGERVPVPGTNDEIGHLARTVNTMLDRLDDASRSQQRFVVDASHELRSPLAVIRTEAEVALAQPEAADWSSVGQAVLHETGRLEGLVTDLLVLAGREDAGGAERGGPTPTSTAEPTDVEEVVMAEAARTRRVPVDTRRVLAGRVAARPGDIARIARHLLDNAARHAAAAVEVAVTTDGSDVVLVVDDDGAGVPVHERTRIFERFARLDEARSRDEGGAGLGLAVVAAVVHGLGGTVTVADAPLGGARFQVRLPVATGPTSSDRPS